MATPLNSIEDILLLRPGTGLAKLEELPTNSLVKEFQRMLGAGTLCEELDIFDLMGAERCKRELTVHLLDAPELIENRAEVDADSLAGLWPIFSHGDGHTFYYSPSRRRFLAHYHDPDILEDTGGSLAQA